MQKTILITGSTDGIGKLVAIKFANEGHHVLLHGRSAEKLQKAISEIKEANPDATVNGYLADFSVLDSVRTMASKTLQEQTKIDVLINNAGVFKAASSNDAIDIRFRVNYLAPYLLTYKLLPLLGESSSPRILNLSSAAQSPVSSQALHGANLGIQEAYAQSKLALTMWSFYLAKKHPSIDVIAVNPGSLLNTKMVREAYGKSWSPADKGANILYELALSDEYANASGKYFDNDIGVMGLAHDDAYNAAKIEQLITLTETILQEV